MKKIFIIPLLLLALNLTAAPIGEQRARKIATYFFQNGATRSANPTLELAWAGDDLAVAAVRSGASTANIDESLLYIYNRTDAKGHIVVAGDDTVRPIIAFSYDNPIDMNNLAPGLRFMLSSWSKQIAAARAGSYTSTRVAGDDVGDVVIKYNTALWNQGEPFNNYAPVIDGYNSVTGCVATALSIICHYNKWPDYAVGTTAAYEYTDDYGVSHSMPSLKLGHTYNYSTMRTDNYESGYTAAEGDAVATLMRDIGYGVKMQYHYVGSGAYDLDALASMTTYFRYSKQAEFVEYGGYTESEWVDLLIDNITKCGPTYFSGVDYGRNDVHVGHAFVLDGYTTGKYISINYGWGGSGNAFYILPNIDYMHNQSGFLGMVPDPDGTTQASGQLGLTTVYYESGEPAYAGLTVNEEVKMGVNAQITFGALINRSATTFNGRFRFAHCDKSGNVKWTSSEYNLRGLDPYYYTYGQKSITLTEPISEGDKIVLQYLSDNSQEWKIARRTDKVSSQAILLLASAEEIAEQLSVSIQNKTNSNGATVKTLVFSHPDIMNFKTMSYIITNASGLDVATGTFGSLERRELEVHNLGTGDFTVKVSMGDNVYQFALTL